MMPAGLATGSHGAKAAGSTGHSRPSGTPSPPFSPCWPGPPMPHGYSPASDLPLCTPCWGNGILHEKVQRLTLSGWPAVRALGEGPQSPPPAATRLTPSTSGLGEEPADLRAGPRGWTAACRPTPGASWRGAGPARGRPLPLCGTDTVSLWCYVPAAATVSRPRPRQGNRPGRKHRTGLPGRPSLTADSLGRDRPRPRRPGLQWQLPAQRSWCRAPPPGDLTSTPGFLSAFTAARGQKYPRCPPASKQTANAGAGSAAARGWTAWPFQVRAQPLSVPQGAPHCAQQYSFARTRSRVSCDRRPHRGTSPRPVLLYPWHMDYFSM